ncbi:MAG: DUF4241 domain-containing protein, partial [Armatimonadetes bacterium]|nr:DUF4241 domain-containing protein [Armatimonadota bacterium]
MTDPDGVPDFDAAFYHADALVQTERREIPLARPEVGKLTVVSGKIVACDGFIPSMDAFAKTVPPGDYPVILSITDVGSGGLVAAALVQFSEERPLVWDMANIAGRDASRKDLFRYGVDSGAGCFADLEAMQVLLHPWDAYDRYAEAARKQVGNAWTYNSANVPVGDNGLNIIAFSSGEGDGSYPSYFGYDRHGNIVCLATDFGIISRLPR